MDKSYTKLTFEDLKEASKILTAGGSDRFDENKLFFLNSECIFNRNIRFHQTPFPRKYKIIQKMRNIFKSTGEWGTHKPAIIVIGYHDDIYVWEGNHRSTCLFQYQED